ncbi:MAG TPA: hypothetical protein VFA18_05475 [Gemmataceae bacterium]|nr:hypothetical protein [Gemmataceae bacterium]
MNLEHLRAFVWLRWRLMINRLKKGGTANVVALIILSVLGVLLGLGMFVGFLMLSMFALAHAQPAVLLYIWDGVVVACLFVWMIGLVTELQRSEPLSLDRFLHLPVSVAGAFLINYVSSLFSLTLLLFLPALLGLMIGMVISRGPQMLWLVPLVAAFLLMLTAVTYQFQGWLASLMVNKRRRRTIIVIVTMTFIVVAQLPNLANVLHLWGKPGPDAKQQEFNVRLGELKQQKEAGKITDAEYQRQLRQIEEEIQARDHALAEQIERTAVMLSTVLPPGWLPLGAYKAAQGAVVVPLLAVCGMTLIGTASLWRAYRTTLRFYTGSFTARKKKQAASAAVPARADPAAIGLMERQLPWVSEHVSAVALSTLRSLQRAPEAKMLLLTPILMAVIFGSMLLTRQKDMSPLFRPVVAFGALVMVMLSTLQLLGNQFGFDRNGFRVFVLCPARRRDILLGKNLAFAVPALGLGAILVIAVELCLPMRLDLLLALVPQAISMYALYCILANVLSILAPMRINPGSLRAAKPGMLTMLTYLLFTLVTGPLLAITLLPLGAQYLAMEFGWSPALPICLLLSLLECAAILLLYRLMLPLLGDLLQGRELKILNAVTTRDD